VFCKYRPSIAPNERKLVIFVVAAYMPDNIIRTGEKLLATTLSGKSRTNRSVELRNLIFPESARSLRLDKCELWVLDSSSVRYDAVGGQDLRQDLKMDICYSEHKNENGRTANPNE
jgi:hypothetical protein